MTSRPAKRCRKRIKLDHIEDSDDNIEGKDLDADTGNVIKHCTAHRTPFASRYTPHTARHKPHTTLSLQNITYNNTHVRSFIIILFAEPAIKPNKHHLVKGTKKGNCVGCYEKLRTI